jgi:hypothetical protein
VKSLARGLQIFIVKNYLLDDNSKKLVERFVQPYNTVLVRSRAGINLRPSHLDRSVRLSPHCAPDILSLRVCPCGSLIGKARVFLQSDPCGSCGCNHDKTHVLLQGCSFPNYCDCHLRDVNVSVLPLRT